MYFNIGFLNRLIILRVLFLLEKFLCFSFFCSSEAHSLSEWVGYATTSSWHHCAFKCNLNMQKQKQSLLGLYVTKVKYSQRYVILIYVKVFAGLGLAWFSSWSWNTVLEKMRVLIFISALKNIRSWFPTSRS